MKVGRGKEGERDWGRVVGRGGKLEQETTTIP